ncbi:MAG: N-acetyltransferase [Candidatus Izimaplasma sp.]|nr:N-acetyltransferase [Candidatus Izimaplasma bacterium]
MEYIYETNRIYAEDEEKLLLAETTFPKKDDNTVVIDRVYVDKSLRGEGRASEIMLKTYHYLKEQNKEVIAKCPYAIHWFKKHPKYRDILVKM